MSDWDPSGKVDVLDMLEMLEIENIRREGFYEARFSCPYPGHENGDASASAYMNLETTAWFCHGCKRKGNAVGFSASMLNISPMKAKRLLREAYDPSSMDPDKRNITQELADFFAKRRAEVLTELNKPIHPSLIDRFAVDWQSVAEADPEDLPWEFAYMIDRGFTWETLEDWEFGYDSRTNRIIFPVRDEHGQIVGVKARATDDRHPKYLVLGDAADTDYYGFGRYYTGSVVFGLGQAVAHGSDHLIICEGELNAIALWQMGYTNAVALNGSNLTRGQEKLIRRYAGSATFYFDFDKAGQEGLWGRDDEDTGEHYPGALERLSVDLGLRLVGSFDDDAAELLADGRDDEAHRLIEDAQSYVVARLLRTQ